MWSWAQKPATSLKRCKIGPRLLWRTSRKSHTRFRLVLKSITLDDLERPAYLSLKCDVISEIQLLSVDACLLFTWRSILPNFIQVLFEITESLAFLKSIAPASTRRTITRWEWYGISSWSNWCLLYESNNGSRQEPVNQLTSDWLWSYGHRPHVTRWPTGICGHGDSWRHRHRGDMVGLAAT